MALEEYLGRKWIHTVLVLVLALLIIGPAFIDVFPEIDRPILGLVPVVAWSLGVNYERSVLIVAGLVDREELREAEKQGASFWGS